MKNIAVLTLVFVFSCCATKTKFYRGYVYSKKKPLVNVTVKTDDNNDSTTTLTDSKGFFRIEKHPNRLSSLIFRKETFVSDTIPSVWLQHGEKIRYTFLNKENDTVWLSKRP